MFITYCNSYQNKLLWCLCPQLNIHWGPQSMMYLKGKRELHHKAEALLSLRFTTCELN